MISDYIKSYRERMNYTQSELVALIRSTHESFNSLDEITLSRWENGHTKPSTRKQVALLILFDFLEDFNMLYGDEHKESGKLERVLSKRYKDNFSESDNPYGVCSPEITVNYYKSVPESRLSFYSDYIKRFNHVDLNVTELSQLHANADKVALYEFKSISGAMLGHCLYMILDNDFIKETLYRKSGYEINLSQGTSIYILTMYSSSKNIFIFQNQIILEGLLAVKELPRHLLIKCFFSELTPIYESMDAEVIAKGELAERGIKYFNNRYSWIQYKINIINMLSSKEFYVDEELIKNHFIINEIDS